MFTPVMAEYGLQYLAVPVLRQSSVFFINRSARHDFSIAVSVALPWVYETLAGSFASVTAATPA